MAMYIVQSAACRVMPAVFVCFVVGDRHKYADTDFNWHAHWYSLSLSCTGVHAHTYTHFLFFLLFFLSLTDQSTILNIIFQYCHQFVVDTKRTA